MRIPVADLYARALERNYSIASVEPCIVQRFDDGTAEIDIYHHSYPHSIHPVEVLHEGSQTSVSLFEKAANFVTAAAKHVAAGAPMASDEEVASRFAICQGCEHFDGKACGKCGCQVNRERAYLSKLSWADQSCPVGKWGPSENG